MYLEILQGTLKSLWALAGFLYESGGAKFSMKIKYSLLLSKLTLLLETQDLFKSWKRPDYLIKSKGPFTFPQWKN